MQLYLITGFLGAGKTTMLKNMVGMFPGEKLFLIINEFGKAGVDGSLVADVGAVLEEINNGSVFCACRIDKFYEVLKHAAASLPDVIIVEASGLSDPTGIWQILQQPEFASIDYRGSICLVDAARFEKVISTARAVPKQLSVSGLVLVNKADMVTPEQLEQVVAQVRAAAPGAAVHITMHGGLDARWLQELQPRPREVEYEGNRPDMTLQKVQVRLAQKVDTEKLRHFLKMFLEDSWRVKAFVAAVDGSWQLVDCVGAQLIVTDWQGEPPKEPNVLVVLAGPGMPLRKSLKKAAEWYPELVQQLEFS